MSTGNKTLRGGRESDDEADMMMITVMPLLSRRSGGLALSTVVVVVVVFLFCASIGTNADSMLDRFLFQIFCFPNFFV